MERVLQRKFWRLNAIFHVVLACYLLFFVFSLFPKSSSGVLAWAAHQQSKLAWAAGLYLAFSLAAAFWYSGTVVWILFIFDALGSVLAVASASPALLPVLLAPGLMAAFSGFPSIILMGSGLAAQLMAFTALLLSDLAQHSATAGDIFPLLGFGFGAVLTDIGSMVVMSSVSRMLKENRQGEGLLDLIQVSHEMGSIHNYDRISGLLTTVIRTMFEAHSFGLYVIEEEEAEGGKKRMATPRWIESSHPKVFLAFELGVENSVMAEVMRSGKPQIVHDLREKQDRLLTPLPSFRAGLFHPVLFEEEVLGLIFLISGSPGTYDQEQQALLGLFSTQVAVTLKNISLYQKTATMAITDSLTNLYTHGYFQDQLMKLIVEHKYNEKPLGLIILDVDHFKVINDSYGHPQGDYILRQLAGLVKTLCRREDIVSRYGGDEFVLILPGADRVSASAFAERIRQAVEEYSFVTGRKVVNVTISAGVSTFPEKLTPKDLIVAADEALYESKKRGRNRIFYV